VFSQAVKLPLDYLDLNSLRCWLFGLHIRPAGMYFAYFSGKYFFSFFRGTHFGSRPAKIMYSRHVLWIAAVRQTYCLFKRRRHSVWRVLLCSSSLAEPERKEACVCGLSKQDVSIKFNVSVSSILICWYHFLIREGPVTQLRVKIVKYGNIFRLL